MADEDEMASLHALRDKAEMFERRLALVDDLVAFLRARLDEDERLARAVTSRQPYDEWDAVGASGDDDPALSHWGVTEIASAARNPGARDIARHIARHDPARVLADVESKRRIIEVMVSQLKIADILPPEHGPQARARAYAVLQLLAHPFASHPDHREEYRP